MSINESHSWVFEFGRILRRIIVKFDNRGTFALEWAELLNGDIQGTGSIYFNQGDVTRASSEFSASVPINGSLWLLGSGLICLIGIRRKMR